MVVYVVVEWESYEGSKIVGIFRKEEDANKVADAIKAARGVEFWHGASVDIYAVVEDLNESMLSSVA